jgi:hypothetical protein
MMVWSYIFVERHGIDAQFLHQAGRFLAIGVGLSISIVPPFNSWSFPPK